MRRKDKENKIIKIHQRESGITLLALVITVIIIIILATVIINFIFGENGLVKRAEQAKLEQEIETARETLTMVLGDAFVEKEINPKYDQNEFLDEFIRAREPNVYLEKDVIGLNGHVFSLDRSVPQLGEYQGEQTGPRIKEIKITEETTSSVSIEVITENTEGATYEYWYKNDTEGEEQWKKVETDNKSNTCTINGLTQGETYNIKVVVATKDGSAEGKINVYLGTIPEGTITFTNQQWVGDGTATVVINTTAQGYTLQYQKNSTEGTWTDTTSGATIPGLHHGDIVYGRLWDGKNGTKDDATVTIKDEIAPTISDITTSVTENSITVNVTATDSQSGVATYTYALTGGETASNETGSYTFTGLSESTDYTIQVKVTDNAGQIATESAEVTTDGEKVKPVESIDGVTVPVPIGYTASDATGENSVNGGFVIYEGTEEVNDSNVNKAKTTRNQFVWIPVPDISEISNQKNGTDNNGRQNYQGKLYNFSATGATEMNEEGTTRIEPDIARDYDGTDATDDASSFIEAISSSMTRKQFKTQLQEEFNEMIASVDTYGGFYIGRYETGNLKSNISTEPVVVKGNSNISNVNWYYMYQNSKKVAANNNVVSTMIWGCMWDRTLIWLEETGDKTYAEMDDSRSWGNHSDSIGDAATNSGSKQPTGTNDAWKANNIYDLAGNVFDVTLEADTPSYRVTRSRCLHGERGVCFVF